jgi:predicted nucleic acid-binding protein
MGRMKFLLDTCVASELTKETAPPQVLEWLNAGHDLAVAMGAVVEINRGIEMVRVHDRAKARRLTSLWNRALSGRYRVISTDFAVARLLGLMMARPELMHIWNPDSRSKKPSFGQDLHIAAAAIVHGYAVATYDIRHFKQIDRYFPLCGVFDPRDGVWHAPRCGIRRTSGWCAPARFSRSRVKFYRRFTFVHF